MEITVTDARCQLGHLVTRAQDPWQRIILTHHGRPVAALMSMEEAERIWQLQNDRLYGPRNPLTGVRWGQGKARDMVFGKNGRLVTWREAALQVQEVQRNRREEREVLLRGGLEPVTGGELGEVPSWTELLWRMWREFMERRERRLKAERMRAEIRARAKAKGE